MAADTIFAARLRDAVLKLAAHGRRSGETVVLPPDAVGKAKTANLIADTLRKARR